MPAPVLKTWSKKYKISMKRLERWWNESKSQAEKSKIPKDGFYPYVVGIMKKRLHFSLRHKLAASTVVKAKEIPQELKIWNRMEPKQRLKIVDIVGKPGMPIQKVFELSLKNIKHHLNKYTKIKHKVKASTNEKLSSLAFRGGGGGFHGGGRFRGGGIGYSPGPMSPIIEDYDYPDINDVEEDGDNYDYPEDIEYRRRIRGRR
jgi:hypothetical protein